MEKKVLLKKLTDGGTRLRTEFTPTAIVSDFGERPIGEFWDANKTIDVIVNGSHKDHDTIKELDAFAHNIKNQLDSEITRATDAEEELDTKINQVQQQLSSNIQELETAIIQLQQIVSQLQSSLEQQTPSED